MKRPLIDTSRGYCTECGYVFENAKPVELDVPLRRKERSALAAIAKLYGVSVNQLVVKLIHEKLQKLERKRKGKR